MSTLRVALLSGVFETSRRLSHCLRQLPSLHRALASEQHNVGVNRATDSPIELVIDDMIRACSSAGLADDIMAMVEARLAHRKM